MCKPNTRRGLTLKAHTITRTDVPNVVMQHTCRDSSVQQKNTSAKLGISLDILQAYVSRKRKLTSNPKGPKHSSCKQVQFMQKEVLHMTTQMRKALVKLHFACKSRSNASRIKNKKVPRPTHLIINLAYILKPHHSRNLYLRARLDTCTDVNLMPASVYQLVF